MSQCCCEQATCMMTGFWFLASADFFPSPLPDRHKGPPSLVPNAYPGGLFPWTCKGYGLKLTILLRSGPSSKMHVSKVTIKHTPSWRRPKTNTATNLPLPSPFVILTNKNKRPWSFDSFAWSLGSFLFHAVKFRMHYALVHDYCLCDFVFIERNVRSEGRGDRGVEKTT